MNRRITYLLLFFLMGCVLPALSQRLPGRLGNLGGMGGGMGGSRGARAGGGADSIKFEHRDPFEDSVSIRFKYIDSVRSYNFDSSLLDFYLKIPLKPEYVWLGNNGTATASLLFNPNSKPGWDAGFHAFDPYAFTIEQTQFFNTTRPFTELNYLIGSGAEQFIHVLHTQNIRPNWNFAFQFRLINSPGFFRSQSTNHSNLRFNTYYQSPKKRYGIYFVALANGLQSAESGGIVSDSFLLDKSGVFKDRFNVPINTGGLAAYSRDPFNTQLKTGNKYNFLNVLVRQQYDLGKKDSLVTDSSVIRFYYPRFRFEHTVQYNTYKYLFQDISPDSIFYQKNYDISVDPQDTIFYKDVWKELINDLSVYQFPDIRNQQQFLKLGASIQNLSLNKGDPTHNTLYNIFLHGEYRNRTRNKKWDIGAFAHLYTAGFNAGDYRAFISLERLLGTKLGSLQLGFENANRTPSYLMSRPGNFPVTLPTDGMNKENITRLFGTVSIPSLQMELSGHYYLVNNYAYFKSFYEAEQQSSPFNVLLIKGSKDFRLSKYWHWYADLVLQKTAGNTPVNLPLIYMRNRLVFQGQFFKNLNIALGLDSRYNTPYYADNYSLITGQFFPQDSIRIANLPDIAAFVHFRIRSFSAFVRLENLNTIDFSTYTFTNNNFAAPLYPYEGLLFKAGIFWNFVN